MYQVINRIALAAILTIALTACGISGPASVPGLKRIVGTDLVGAIGATPQDQKKIDKTVVGICAGGVWTPEDCARHQREKERRK